MLPQLYGTCYFGKRYPIQTLKPVIAEYGGNIAVSTLNVIPVYVQNAVEISTLNTYLATVKVPYPQIYGMFQYGVRYPIRKATNTTPAEIVTDGRVYPLEVILVSVLTGVDASVFITRAQSFTFEFLGEFKPNDILVIDSRNFTVTLNGENALHLVGRDQFPEIMPGENEWLYSDASGTRLLRIRVKWRDRWM